MACHLICSPSSRKCPLLHSMLSKTCLCCSSNSVSHPSHGNLNTSRCTDSSLGCTKCRCTDRLKCCPSKMNNFSSTLRSAFAVVPTLTSSSSLVKKSKAYQQVQYCLRPAPSKSNCKTRQAVRSPKTTRTYIWGRVAASATACR